MGKSQDNALECNGNLTGGKSESCTVARGSRCRKSPSKREKFLMTLALAHQTDVK
jgi:hypothetical protein